MGKARIGILGGTFDPIHIGHLIIASELRYALDLTQIRFVPAGDPPHKPDQRLSAVEHRLAMLERAIAERADFAIVTVDLERAGPSFTKDTLATLQAREPEAELIFLMGADSLRDLPTWKDPQRILELAEIGAAARPDVTVDLESLYAQLPAARGRVTVVDVPLIEVSSRDLRERVASGRPITYQVPPAVERYIFEHGLYRERCSEPARLI